MIEMYFIYIASYPGSPPCAIISIPPCCAIIGRGYLYTQHESSSFPRVSQDVYFCTPQAHCLEMNSISQTLETSLYTYISKAVSKLETVLIISLTHDHENYYSEMLQYIYDINIVHAYNIVDY